jgi:hypothetical protein
MATNKTVFMALGVFGAMVLIAGLAWTAGSNRNKHRAASPEVRPAPMPAEVGDDRPPYTTTSHRSALDSSTTQWDRADTREVTKGTSP